jgi:predicted lipase
MIAPRPLAALCAAAYDHTDLVVGEAKALTAETPDGIVIAWQGTHDARQAFDDMDVRPKYLPGVGYVHHGFSDLASAAYPEVLKRLDAAPGLPAVLTGHSLGGALAILTAAMLVRDKHEVAGVVCFGPPRVSIGAAVGRIFRRRSVPALLYRHGIDAVPELPPVFMHPADLIQIGIDGDPIEDHAIARYVEALASA